MTEAELRAIIRATIYIDAEPYPHADVRRLWDAVSERVGRRLKLPLAVLWTCDDMMEALMDALMPTIGVALNPDEPCYSRERVAAMVASVGDQAGYQFDIPPEHERDTYTVEDVVALLQSLDGIRAALIALPSQQPGGAELDQSLLDLESFDPGLDSVAILEAGRHAADALRQRTRTGGGVARARNLSMGLRLERTGSPA